MNSEDKKIKGELIELIGCMHDADPRKERWLSWLEKQQTMNPKEMRDLLKMEYSKGRYDAITKTVEWLYQRQTIDLEVPDIEKFIEDFRKSMEEQQ